jgi:3-hydroxyisobutyrate dehydrogenase
MTAEEEGMKVTVIGTGLMGRPLAERLLGAGHEVTVFNRTREKAEPLAGQGAKVAASARAAVAASEVVVFMVKDAAALRGLVEENGRLPDLTGKTVVQMSTIGSADSEALLADVRRAGGDYLEAPVLGSTPQAKEGKLLVLVGGTPEQFERFRDFLKAFGPEPVRVGEVGQAAALKLAFNQLIAAEAAGFALSLGLVRRKGIDVDLFMKLLRQSALHAPTFDAKLPRYLAHDYENPNFPTALLKKDLDLVRREAEAVGLGTTALDGVRAVFDEAIALGLGGGDYAALYEAIDPKDPEPGRS